MATSTFASVTSATTSSVISRSSGSSSFPTTSFSSTGSAVSSTASSSSMSIDLSLNNDGGTAQQVARYASLSATALLSTATVALAVFLVEVAAFLIIRRTLSRIYEPRTYMVPERKKSRPPPKGWFRWLPALLTTRDPEYIAKSGLDSFVFLRFLRMMLKICLLLAGPILPIMLPLNATGGADKDPKLNVQGLNRLSWANIDQKNAHRRTAALLMAIYTICVVCYVTYDEMRGYVRLRQAYLTSPQHRLRASATTVLVTSIPEKWMTYDEMINLYDILPGGLKNVWLNRDYSTLVEKIEMREWLAKNLEGAETDLIKACVKKHLKNIKKTEGKEAMMHAEDGVEMIEGFTKGVPDDFNPHLNSISPRPTSNPFKTPVIGQGSSANANLFEKPDESEGDLSHKDSVGTGDNEHHQKQHIAEPHDPNDFVYRPDPPTAVWRKYLTDKDRPTMRVPVFSWAPSLPLIGKKVDTIYYCRQQIAILNNEIPKLQATPEEYPLMNSAFLQFQSQIAAHMACQATNHHVPLRMAPRYLEVAPTDVIWENLHIRWWDRYLRFFGSNAAVVGLIITWSIPIIFVGSLSQIGTLATQYHWLAWLTRAPKIVLNIIQGVLPPILLALLTSVLLPLLLQTLAQYSGVPTRTAADRAVQNWYFLFLFVTAFFVITVSGAFFSTIKDYVNDPVGIPQKLASTLPRASNFFFSYLLLQALGISGGALLQIGPLILYYILGPILNTTPRAKWSLAKNLNFVTWGTFFPVYTNFGVITIVYSVVAPLMLVFSIMVFGLFWVVYRYNLLWVMDYRVDSGGLPFPKAINHLYVGLYVMEICMIGLFLLVRDVNDSIYCLPHAIIMIVFLFLTVIFQRVMYVNFAPLIEYLPITLEDDADASDKEFQRQYEERRRLLQEGPEAGQKAALEKIDEAHAEPDGQKLGDGKHADEDVTENGEGSATKGKEETAEERARRHQDGHHSDSSSDSSDSDSDDDDDKHNELKRSGTANTKESKKTKKATLGAVANMFGANKIAAIGVLPTKALKKIPGVSLDLVKRLDILRKQEEQANPHETEAEKKKRRLEIARLVRQIRQDDYSDYTDVNELRAHILATQMAVPPQPHYDDEEQQNTESKTRRLFAHVADDLGDLSYEEREALMEQAYKHPCLIARQPAVWIPTDVLGISADEIRNTPPEVWISNENAYLKYKTKVVFEGNAPDFDKRDLIDL